MRPGSHQTPSSSIRRELRFASAPACTPTRCICRSEFTVITRSSPDPERPAPGRSSRPSPAISKFAKRSIASARGPGKIYRPPHGRRERTSHHLLHRFALKVLRWKCSSAGTAGSLSRSRRSSILTTVAASTSVTAETSDIVPSFVPAALSVSIPVPEARLGTATKRSATGSTKVLSTRPEKLRSRNGEAT